MDDLLSEGEQWEALKAWFRRNGVALLAGLVAGGVILGGWRWWGGHQERMAFEAGAKYEQVIAALAKPDLATATRLIDELKDEHGSSGYVAAAQLAAAHTLVASNSLDQAAAHLKAAAETSKDRELALLARLRLARVQIALSKPDEAIATLAAATDAGAFTPRYAEARGDALLAKGDRAGALREYLAARSPAATAAALTGGGSDQLELKINDLQSSAAPAGGATK